MRGKRAQSSQVGGKPPYSQIRGTSVSRGALRHRGRLRTCRDDSDAGRPLWARDGAYWLVAGGLVLIGVIASTVVSVKEHEEEVAEQQATKTDAEEVVSDATAQALVQTPIAVLGALMTLPGGSAGALSAVRLLARNLPLVLLLVMIGMLFWPSKEGERLQDEHDTLRP